MKASIIDLVKNYQPALETKDLLAEVHTLLLAGISGAGKDTIKQQLLARGGYHHVVSHTTRPLRKNHGIQERNGVEYHFIDIDTAEAMLKNHGFIEANLYSNNVYGTSVGEFRLARDEDKIAVTDMEVQGVSEYRQLAPHTVHPVFLVPPSYEVWQARWLQRYGDDHIYHAEDFERRKQTAVVELEYVLKNDFFSVVINKELDKTVDLVDRIAHGAAVSDDNRSVVEQLLQDIKNSMNKNKAQ